jgi:L-amino acid N-acyltransferase YncA
MPRVSAALRALAYPRTRRVAGGKVRFRLMTTVDRDAVLAFARALPAEDLLFLRLDITRDEGVDEWCRNIIARRTITVLAERDGELAGYGSVHHNDLLWTAHLGEIRIQVAGHARGAGIGRALADEMFALGRHLKLDRLFVQMTREQVAARALFERLGFRTEALLADWVKTHDGRLHDLLILSHDVSNGLP